MCVSVVLYCSVFEKCLLPCGHIVRCMFMQSKTQFQANISIFHSLIHYANSSTEYFSNWLGHETPLLPLSMCLFCTKAAVGQLTGGNYLLAGTK